MPPNLNLLRQRIQVTKAADRPNKSGVKMPTGSPVTYNARFTEKINWELTKQIDKICMYAVVAFPLNADVEAGDYVDLPDGRRRPVSQVTYRVDGLGNPLYKEAIL